MKCEKCHDTNCYCKSGICDSSYVVADLLAELKKARDDLRVECRWSKEDVEPHPRLRRIDAAILSAEKHLDYLHGRRFE